MVKRYAQEVETIEANLRELSSMVAENVGRAMEAVLKTDKDLVMEVLRHEQEINRREVALEEACIRVMALHQPVADDLRFLVSTLKVNHDLERIGDLAMSIARRSGALSQEAMEPFTEPLSGLMQDLKIRVQEGMDAFFRKDETRAASIWIADDAIDAQTDALCEKIRQAILNAPPDSAASLFKLLSIVQRMERLADHAANIAKSSLYLTLGEIVRHRMGEFRRQVEDEKPRVLLVCVHNSARSQMGQAFINHLYGDRVLAESAGLQPGVLNPFAVRAMAEVGIDISQARTRDVFEVVRNAHPFSQVITVCDGLSAEKCPPFPGVDHVLHWDLPDPAACEGSEEEKMAAFRKIRDSLRQRIEDWMQDFSLPSGSSQKTQLS